VGPFGEAEFFGVERDRTLYTFDEEHRTRIPDVHSMDLRTAAMIIIAAKVERVMARQAWRSNSTVPVAP
jgi:hypothetical protein